MMNLITLLFVLTLISSIVCDNYVVSLDATTSAPHKVIPVMEYHEIEHKIKNVAMNIDKFIDIIVDTIRMGGKGIDPIGLPDVTETFSDKILFVYVDGQFLMRNGKLHNVKSISRHGNATLRYDNLKLYVTSAFIFKRLDFDYDFIGQIVSVGPQGYLYGDCNRLVIETVFVYDVFHNKLSLNKTSITDEVPVDVQVKISVIIDWLANPIINWLSNLYESKILFEIQRAVERVIKDNLPLSTLSLKEK
uniref:Uncharacterized protein n=1 Tax=Cacopsylla melanoneura TaxID=428564 RepID=A0A8D8S627_9HEMI